MMTGVFRIGKEKVMSRKLTIEFIREEFDKKGWTLISKTYIDSKTKLDCTCPKGHHRSVTWGHWQQGQECPVCLGSRLDIEFIRQEFAKEGLILLTKKYVNAKQKLEYIGLDGYIRTISWTHWQQGQGRCGRRQHTTDFIKSEFGKDDYTYEGEDRSGKIIKYKYKCPEGHHHSIVMSKWLDGARCPYCIGNAKLTIGFIRAEFAKEGYILLTTEYINSKTPLNCLTPCGNRYSISWNNWHTGYRYNKNKITRNIEMVAENVVLYGYTLKSTTYNNNKEKLHLVCTRGHDYFVSWDNWYGAKSRCPKCNKVGKSIWEDIIKKFVKSLNISFLENDRTIILNPDTNRYVELDLWFPNLNKAIECNSKYWHKKRKHIDDLKQEWCKNNNVSLLSVDFDEWNEDIKECQKKIEKFLN